MIDPDVFVPVDAVEVQAVQWTAMSAGTIRKMVAMTLDAHDICLEEIQGSVRFCVTPNKGDKWIDVELGEWLVRRDAGKYEKMQNYEFNEKYRRPV